MIFVSERNSLALQNRLQVVQQKLRSDNNRSLAAADRSERVATRMANIEANERDPLAYERVLGQINLCPINFLARGLDAAKSVARLTVQSEDGNSTWHGTGFLVAPGVLVTNNHVISTRRQAAMAIAEFDYQRDISGTPEAIRTFTLLESEIFFTDERMDVTFVAIAPRASDGTPLSRFGHLPLIRPSGKAINGEYVSIIQHPGGGEKQITIRESRLLVPELDEAELSDGATSLADIDFETFIHYSTDTQPGSSGSPVLNDQWQVVAIHHSAVPLRDEKGHDRTHDGKDIWTPDKGDHLRGWAANEGVRVSGIYAGLYRRQFSDADAMKVIALLEVGLAVAPKNVLLQGEKGADGSYEKQGAPSKPDDHVDAAGYDPDFLNKPVKLPALDASATRTLAKQLDGKTTEFKYHHFSVLFDQERRLPRLTAVNIEGATLRGNQYKERPDWRQDGRMDNVDYQADDTLYYTPKGANAAVEFQRGHLVRNLDPVWGDSEIAKKAQKDTFHFTNCAPHEGTFNNSLWGDLEDYLLLKADSTGRRMSVFSGPIFGSNDPKHRTDKFGQPFLIPKRYWKVAVIDKGSSISAAGFIVDQSKGCFIVNNQGVLTGLDKRTLEGVHGKNRGFSPYTPAELAGANKWNQIIQVEIRQLEKETGLEFGLMKYDKFRHSIGLELNGKAVLPSVRPLDDWNDIII